MGVGLDEVQDAEMGFESVEWSDLRPILHLLPISINADIFRPPGEGFRSIFTPGKGQPRMGLRRSDAWRVGRGTKRTLDGFSTEAVKGGGEES
jgi:hypothetical protein